LKTKKNDASVEGFLNSIDHEKRRTDSAVVLELMKKITREEPARTLPVAVSLILL